MKTIQVMILALMLVGGAGLSACSRPDRAEADREGYALADDRSILNAKEEEFIVYASEMHVGEIAMAEQAKQKSSNEDVTKYADSVIKTHSNALEELSERTRRIGELSKTASSDTQGHTKYLSGLSGTQFDKEFVDLMVADHQSAVDTFHMEYTGTQNTDLRGYMKAALPNLEDRLDSARKLQKKLTSERATGN